MKKLRQITALVLSVLMLFPAQSITVLAQTGSGEAAVSQEVPEEETKDITEETDRIEETLPLQELEDSDNERIEVTLPLQPLVRDEDLVIYWNPGGKLPAETASPSNALKASASNAKQGNDQADGKSPDRPVKTLAAALERVEELKEETGADPSQMTIYAMNPMEIADGQLYVLNAANVRIASWPGRKYSNETIFYVNGGQLSLVNTHLESRKTDADPEKTELVLVHGGVIQFGQSVEIDGRIVMDYRSRKEETTWQLASDANALNTASASNASKSGSTFVPADGDNEFFNIDDYIIDTDIDSPDLIEDEKSASTWCAPIIELIEGFDGVIEGYLLELRTDEDQTELELVRTLYADETSVEEFTDLFAIYGEDGDAWRVTAESAGEEPEEAAARDLGVADASIYQTMSFAAGIAADTMKTVGVSGTSTVKTLKVTRSGSGTEIYWNPGGPVTVSGTTYPAGNDTAFTGLEPRYPVKTWAAAVAAANGGTIICMQSVDLGSGSADDYITLQGDGTYLAESTSVETRVTVRPFPAQPQPAFIVPAGETLVLKNVILGGVEKEGVITNAQTVLCNQGQIIIEENVDAETGFIQINAYSGLKDTPLKVNSIGLEGDGKLTLFFGGINDNLAYRFVDVVVPGDALAGDVTANAEAVGLALKDRCQLDPAHRDELNGGKSRFDWLLRPDIDEDDPVKNLQNLELYADYYFDAVYLNGEDGIGDDANFGATCQYPVKTWARARAIWEHQMDISLAARQTARGLGKSEEYIKEMYPVPSIIYICGTVTVDDAQTWKLNDRTDNGKTISTEIVSHTEAAKHEDGSTVHDVPQQLVKVENGGSLVLEDVTIRNMTDELDSVTIQVEDGGSASVTGSTELTGEREAKDRITAKLVTRGIHVNVKNGGSFTMESSWNGKIMRRQQGVAADGSRASVTMNGGEIRENSAIDLEAYCAGLDTGHKTGTGVVLSGGAGFTMNGGKITENEAYLYGGGVYLSGSGTKFTLNKGEISKNLMGKQDKPDDRYDYLIGTGIGIYAGTGTVLEIGSSTGSADDVLITENSSYVAYGTGIYSDGILNINRARVSDNTAKAATSTYYYTKGIGIYVDTNGTLQMEDTDVTGNYYQKGYVWGGGIYLGASANGNYIKNSRIKDNVLSTQEYSTGGGIFTEGKLTIEADTVISGNQAYFGGGIGTNMEYPNYNTKTNVTILDTIIEANVSYQGSAVYMYGFGTLTLKDGTIIRNHTDTLSNYGTVNLQSYNGAGSLRAYIMAENENGIQITGNVSGHGGAIYQYRSTAYLKNVLISGNKGSLGGAIFTTDSASTLVTNVVIDGNTASSDGGGFWIGTGSGAYLSDCRITGNTADGNGGGIYSIGSAYLSESQAETFIFTGNYAGVNGGGWFKDRSTESFIDIAGAIQNSAGEQGSNLYLKYPGLYLINGHYKQPAVMADGIYNIYADHTTSGPTYLDMADVKVDKKPLGDPPDAIFLNTGNTYLSYLTTPPNNTPGTFPIDVNDLIFKEGSVVIKPADKTTVTMYRPDAANTGVEYYSKDYTGLKDATGNLLYSSEGKLPRRTQLGGFVSGSYTNAVIVGEGVYVSSSGKVTNSGLSPQDPVPTFAQAKGILRDKIQAAYDSATDDDGFSPFIYICGTVNIDGTETWELNDAHLFETINADYITTETNLGYPAYPAQVRRFASFVTAPLIKVPDGNELIADNIIIDGMAEAVIANDQSDYSPILVVGASNSSTAKATLKGNATLRNNYYDGVQVYGSLYLEGNDGDLNEQLINQHGYAARLRGKDASMEMSGYSAIVTDDQVALKTGSRSAYGVYSEAENSRLLMKDHSKIFSLEDSTIAMGYAIGWNSVGADIQLQDFAKLTGMYNGFYLSDRMSGKVWINKNADADPDDSVEISPMYTGFYMITGLGLDIAIGKKAVIAGGKTASYAFDISGSTIAANVEKTQITLEDYAKVTGWYFGVFNGTRSVIRNPIHITMKDWSMIEDSKLHAIYEAQEGQIYNGFAKLNVEMKDYAKITGSGGSAIYLRGNYELGTGDYQKITMSDFASIEDNAKAAINGNGPFELLMEGESQITGNGSSDLLPSEDGNAIYLTRYTSAYYRPGQATITLKDTASINGNRGGIYVQPTADPVTYPNPCVITMDGLTGTGVPSIENNTNSISINSNSTLKLQGAVTVGKSTTTTDEHSIYATGSIELDGRSNVAGQIRLYNYNIPITMTYKAIDPYKEYHLWLAEGFMGKVVVQPDDPENLSGGITDVTDQIGYFIKDGADGSAKDKPLKQLAPNIVLQGENNVYLAGNGKDSNDGNTPSTAVRTFARAKELLETGPFSEGANIIICNATVDILAGDTDWSFDENGEVTNNGVSWKPLLLRYSQFSSIMIRLPDNADTMYAGEVTFRNITIDGGSETGLRPGHSSQLLYVGTDRRALIQSGAVFQNNVAETIYSYNEGNGITVKSGYVEFDGGTIRNIGVIFKGTTSSTMASALDISGTSDVYPGVFDFKSGQIRDNCMEAKSGLPMLNIIKVRTHGTLNMSGGVIEDNEINFAEENSGMKTRWGSTLGIDGGTFNMSGGSIRNNKGIEGSALFYNAGNVILSGGQIHDNTVVVTGVKPQGTYSPIKIGADNFQLKGGGCDIRDNIYIHSTQFPIKVSGNITQTDRLYHVYLRTGSSGYEFKKGSVVVRPDGTWMKDITGYLANFEVHANPYVLDRGQVSAAIEAGDGTLENECLILMRAVYLDSQSGENYYDGLTPGTAVKTFYFAKQRGASGYGSVNYYIIYVSGTAETNGDETWTLPEPAYMCRYTGFPVYDSSGNATETADPCYGVMIDAKHNLTLEGLTIYGRRSIDTTTNRGDSIVRVNDGKTVTVNDVPGKNTIFGRNYNIGSYFDKDKGALTDLSSTGGAFQVLKGGMLKMNGGIIADTDAAYGKAIYLEADETDQSVRAQMTLSNSPAISGSVHLGGTGAVTYAYLEPDNTFVPAAQLAVTIQNDFDGRPVIVYPEGSTPSFVELERFYFDDAIQALYDIVNRTGDAKTFELSMRRAIYLDGQNGDDDNHDGSAPDKAFKTLKRVYQEIGPDNTNDGILVYIVDTVDVKAGTPNKIELSNILVRNLSAGESYHLGYYKDETLGTPIEIKGQIYFKRYVQPGAYSISDPDFADYTSDTLEGNLFRVKNGGSLTLNGIYVDGHSQPVSGTYKTLTAPGVNAKAPLVTVEAGGELICEMMDKNLIANGVDTATLFANNINITQKTNVIGVRDGSNIIEGSGAGIEILGGNQTGGTVTLRRVEFRNLELGKDVVSGGTDVYNYGNLRFYESVLFGGSVFLEGFGVMDEPSTHDTSCYMGIVKYGRPALNDFQVLMRDPYTTRKVVYYEPEDVGGSGVEIDEDEIGAYRLEERVKNYFSLGKRSGAPWILELQVPVAVYIDGNTGDDDPNDPDRGSTPSKPVKTMRRAYELLKTRAGNTIYVVDTVAMNVSADLTGVSYLDTNGNSIKLGSTDRVKIIRYIQPDFAAADLGQAQARGYDVADFTGVMISIENGAVVTFGSNLFVDGHSEKKETAEYPAEMVVSHTTEAKGPMIKVESGSTLELLSGSTLYDNDNSYNPADGDTGFDGGVVYNSGTTLVNGAVFDNNKALKGSAAYQDGIFTIVKEPENLAGHSFYLTTDNQGTDAAPVWGADHVIQTEVMIPDSQIFDVDMDHAVKGRDVVRFMNSSAFDPNADAEHDHFKLGSTVPSDLFLVEALDDPMVLELQNWEVLEVAVPDDIYLVVRRKGANESSNKVLGVRTDAAGSDVLTSPDYTIRNNGRFEVKVSVSGFENLNDDAGITANGHDKMTLVDLETNAVGNKDLYLAIKGLDSGSNGITMAETSLKPYGETVVTEEPAEMGILKPDSSGRFTFTGAVGSGFIDKYKDPGFPIAGTRVQARQHMDGTSASGIVNARAKYALKYKVEINPSRRDNGTTP